MFDANGFGAALCRIRAGDEQAAADLVQKYEPLIRREVRLHLEDQRLRRVFDSMDVVQSVWASFFIRTACGEYDLENPDQLLRLLVRMTRNKLASAARREYRQRRDTRRTTGDDGALQRIAAEDPTASRQVADQELLEAVRHEMSPEVCQLAELRADGLSWDEVAARLGGKAQARRMQLARGIARAGRKLGLCEFDD